MNAHADFLSDVVRTRTLTPDGVTPLVVEPVRSRDPEALVSWVNENLDALREKLRVHGAILFRGFDIHDAKAFESLARAVDDQLQNKYFGTSPREALTDYVFTASELPGFYPIPQHCEMSFIAEPPRHLFFWAKEAPHAGGETPLCDFRAVYRDMDPEVRQRFVDGGIRIIRNYEGPEGADKRDLWKLKRWDEIFKTTDRAEVERMCAEQEFEPIWKDGGRLALISEQPAVREHPETGEMAWFNHVQVFHLTSGPGELKRIFTHRPKDLRSGALAAVTGAMVMMKKLKAPAEEQAMHCTYADGREIPEADLRHVRDLIWKHLVVYPWRTGDVVAIDNRSVSHGRLPYNGPRQIAVAWA